MIDCPICGYHLSLNCDGVWEQTAFCSKCKKEFLIIIEENDPEKRNRELMNSLLH